MKIERTELISELLTFATTGNGVVFGQPGGGKTHALGELRARLKVAGIPHLILPVERLGRASEPEIKNVLQREGDFIALLRSAVTGAKAPAVLIFDGFDAARGENERAGVFQLILRAVTELAGSWNTIVSVRTFDARKSQRLLDLFPDRKRQSDGPAPCRQFRIPELRADEVKQALTQISGLQVLHDNGTVDFRALLTVPFNLWLIERVLNAGANTMEFSRVTSEVQLLEMYWDYRIRKGTKPEDREFILGKATTAMVESHTLTVRRDLVYQPDIREAWEGLLSDEVFVEVPGREAGVAFTHNILFDFAVSAHLLDSAPSKLADFVAQEPARPLFLRPSLVYHFTRLWHFDRDSFWRNFWAVVQRDEMHLRQIVRLVLPAVIVNEAQTVADLNPLLERLRSNTPPAVEAVAFQLQALRVLKSAKIELWAEFLRMIAPYLHRQFAWDAGTIAAGLIEPGRSLPERSRADCGELGRRLLGWAWAGRKDTQHGHWLERLAGLIAVPLVAKTFSTNPQESKALLENVLGVIGEPDFSIDCIYRLVNEVQYLIPYDPQLVGLVYERVFGYEEQSDAKTNMGGPVLALISNRRQDYESCRYSLIQIFPRFLADAPLPAVSAGIRAVQTFAVHDHVLRYLREGKTLSDLTIPFNFRGNTAHYFEDGSRVWDESGYPDQEIALASAIFTWLGNAAENEQANEVDSFLDVFTKEARAAFLWARLLVVGAEHPQFLGPRIWELAIATPVVEGLDTLVSLGAYLENATESLSHSQRSQIEEVILGLVLSDDPERKEVLERRRNRLLARIPADRLVTEAGITLRSSLEASSQLPPNSPLFSFSSSSEPYNEEMMFRQQGVKAESPPNAEVRALYRPLSEWVETKKEETRIDGLLPTARALRDLLAKEHSADAPVLSAASTHLASFASDALLRTKDPKSERFQILRSMVLAAAEDAEPRSDLEHDAKWNSAVWSPAPRIEAAQALAWLTHFGQDAVALAAIKKLARDSVPAVRFLLVCELWRLHENNATEMWELFDDLAANEQNGIVLQGLTRSLGTLIGRDQKRSMALVQKLLSRVEETDDEEKARASLVAMVVDFAVEQDDSWAKETLMRWRKKPLEFASSLALAGSRLIEYLKPQHTGTKLERSRTLLLEHLEASAQGLCFLQKKDNPASQEEIQKKWRLLYGVIDNAVMRIYFAADIDPQLRQRSDYPLDDPKREQFFHDALPILKKILSFGSQPETGMLLAPTAHYFMELLNGVLRYNPALVLSIAAEVVECSKRFNYNLDSMAMKETVKLVESLLADYREKIQDDDSIRNLLGLLDTFVEAGWPEALNLVWRLDEIYR